MSASDNQPKHPPRGRRKAGETPGRELLLRAAVKHFSRLGYDGASLRAIAADAGVDMALVARLFGSKEKLWQALIGLLDERRLPYKKAMRALAAIKDRDPAAAFRGMLELYAKVSIEMPELIGILFQEVSNPGERQDTVVKHLITPFRNDCKPVIEACIAAKMLRATNANLVFGIISSAIILPLILPQFCGRQANSRRRLGALLVEEAMTLLMRRKA